MLDVVDGDLVVEEKGIYSIEKFIIARRLMYWQVYLHKTVVSSERLLISILKRAMYCAGRGMDLFASPALRFFLLGNFTKKDFQENEDVIRQFVLLDDADILGAIKVWCTHPDPILSDLCKRLVNRKLLRVLINDKPFDDRTTENLRNQTREVYNLFEDEEEYYFQTGVLENNAYNLKIDGIGILRKNGKVEDIVQASDNGSMMAQAESVKKYMIYLPKEIKNFS
jgi:HD superfamily phosphohydrolase